MANTPRLYEPSWQALKKSEDSPKRIVIAAPLKFHPRIYKAIIKEKDMDLMYKLALAENSQKSRLTKNSKNGKLTIFMHLSFGLDDI